jgi:hypothetical protein
MRYSHTAVLLAAALSLTALASPATAQAASAYNHDPLGAVGAIIAAPFAVIGAPFDALTDSRALASHPNVVPRAATAQVPEVGDPSCHLEIYNSFGVVPGGVHRYTTMCGPQ